MPKINVSFYVLSANKAQDFLGFICQLTQTALNKSAQSLLILVEDEHLLSELDSELWSYTASGFIPHQRLTINDTADNSAIDHSNTVADTVMDTFLAPVLLASYLPTDFKGMVINTTTRPVNDFITATNNTHLSRILEIIKPDATSVQNGRSKYKHYQQLGYELTHFKV